MGTWETGTYIGIKGKWVVKGKGELGGDCPWAGNTVSITLLTSTCTNAAISAAITLLTSAATNAGMLAAITLLTSAATNAGMLAAIIFLTSASTNAGMSVAITPDFSLNLCLIEATLVDVPAMVGRVWMQGVPCHPLHSLYPVQAVISVDDVPLLPNNLV